MNDHCTISDIKAQMVKLPLHIPHGLQAFRRLTIIIRNNLALYKRTVTWMLGIRVPLQYIELPNVSSPRMQGGKGSERKVWCPGGCPRVVFVVLWCLVSVWESFVGEIGVIKCSNYL